MALAGADAAALWAAATRFLQGRASCSGHPVRGRLARVLVGRLWAPLRSRLTRQLITEAAQGTVLASQKRDTLPNLFLSNHAWRAAATAISCERAADAAMCFKEGSANGIDHHLCPSDAACGTAPDTMRRDSIFQRLARYSCTTCHQIPFVDCFDVPQQGPMGVAAGNHLVEKLLRAHAVAAMAISAILDWIRHPWGSQHRAGRGPVAP